MQKIGLCSEVTVYWICRVTGKFGGHFSTFPILQYQLRLPNVHIYCYNTDGTTLLFCFGFFWGFLNKYSCLF